MRVLSLAALLLPLPALAQEAEAPLSAIDWLSRSVAPSPAPVPAPPPAPAQPPVSRDASPLGIEVGPLEPAPQVAGLLPPEVTGLPPDLWSGSETAALLALIREDRSDWIPALQDLLVTLMLAESPPPADEAAEGTLFLARVDRLLALGEIEAAQSLLEAGNLLDRETFRRWFDATLLTGTETDACEMLRTHPSLAPTLEARVFCLARNGDWNAAALTLSTARALGDVSEAEDLLLSRFLDDGGEDEEAPAGPPPRPTPLTYRMLEAVGETIPTTGLPLAYAFLDLRPTVAWRAQIEAAERLARRAALSENVLLAVYTARPPAASGGVWDRAGLVQRLDAALTAGDAATVTALLPEAWTAMAESGLAVPFSRLFAERVAGLDLAGEADAVARRMILLSPSYGEATLAADPASPREAAWLAVATGAPFEGLAPDAPTSAILSAFAAEIPPERAALAAQGRAGEALLEAIHGFHAALAGDHAAAADALLTLRALGLEDGARRAALQFLILEARA
ncbi:hypothetical protein [Rubellimicrobium sp. CFH 75288]|uniref:hypothetical protein n=1 Tax=Rubellimicrobium sp. CFH 75288 TaxID=2697034 RepID=UPI0014124935|nr:hypothetical protein [Rubellimicrobium sp. CFH 75288]NAZ36986.1 hypothetical protein [Rubellimicrobium sp. CFH 75288]